MATEIVTRGSEREALITRLLRQHCGREVLAFHRLGRDSNNFVYRAELLPIAGDHVQHGCIEPRKRCPGTAALPSSTNNVVARISNPEAILNEEVRVENEVAAMTLMRTALAAYSEKLVPEVFAWGLASPESPGWILQEYKKGVQLDKAFPEMDRVAQEDIQRQIAQVFKLIQDYELPASAVGYWGLAFDDLGENIVIGPTTIPCGGPFATLEDMYVHTCDVRGGINWLIAQNTDREFGLAGVRKPAEITGCGELAAVKWFLEDLSPPYFLMPRWLEHQGPEGIDETLQLVQSNVEKYLERWGF